MDRRELNKLKFLEKAKQIHEGKYDYSKVQYINANTKVCIICPEHKEFYQTPHHHLEGHGCKKCANVKTGSSKVMPLETFIQKANLIHSNRYNYNKCTYINARTKVIITCPIHGDFEQTPDHHLRGVGCPSCASSNGEKLVKGILDEYNINYIQQYEISIDTNINPSGKAYIDFYLPDYNILIEYNGEQHYIQREYFGGELGFNKQVNRDNFIKSYAANNGIQLVEIHYKNRTKQDILKYLEENAPEIFIK